MIRYVHAGIRCWRMRSRLMSTRSIPKSDQDKTVPVLRIFFSVSVARLLTCLSMSVSKASAPTSAVPASSHSTTPSSSGSSTTSLPAPVLDQIMATVQAAIAMALPGLAVSGPGRYLIYTCIFLSYRHDCMVCLYTPSLICMSPCAGTIMYTIIPGPDSPSGGNGMCTEAKLEEECSVGDCCLHTTS